MGSAGFGHRCIPTKVFPRSQGTMKIFSFGYVYLCSKGCLAILHVSNRICGFGSFLHAVKVPWRSWVQICNMVKTLAILGPGGLQNDAQNYHDRGGPKVPWRSCSKGDIPWKPCNLFNFCWISTLGDLAPRSSASILTVSDGPLGAPFTRGKI